MFHTFTSLSLHFKVSWCFFLQYFCVGMSLWDQERLKENSKEARTPTDPVDLPYCEGLEIISASQLQQAPVVLNDAGAASTSQPARDPQPRRCLHQAHEKAHFYVLHSARSWVMLLHLV